jgi:hypothetical protein
MVAKVFYWKPNHVANNIHKNEKNSYQIFIAKKNGCIIFLYIIGLFIKCVICSFPRWQIMQLFKT